MTFLTALAVGWAVTSAVIVGVYLWRYARDMADLRRQEQEYADAIQAKWQARHIPATSTEPNRYLRDTKGAPE